MSTNLQISLEQQIAQLESEISQRNVDIQNLQEAFDTLVSNKPRPVNPAADNAFELLRQMLGSVPENLEQQQLYQAKLTEAQRALELAIAALEQKKFELNGLRQQQREQQQTVAFEELKSKAAAFNQLIDAAVAELEEMRSLAKLAGSGKFEIVADLNEQAYCQITANSVKLRRRFDVLRG